MSILREALEMFIDHLFPFANNLTPPIADFVMHIIIVAIEIVAIIFVYRIARQKAKDKTPAYSANLLILRICYLSG